MCSAENQRKNPSHFPHLTHGDRQRLDDLLVRHGDHALAVYLDDSVADADAAALGYAASHQAADLRAEERRLIGQGGRPCSRPPPLDWDVTLTMPFCTLKPSWNLKSGLLMSTVVTGGQLTMLSFTFTWFFKPWTTNKQTNKQNHPFSWHRLS